MFVLEFLGSTETSGPMTACFPGVDTKQGSVGKGYPQFETEILDGEIVTRGRNCCMGYLWEEEKTAELVDSEGWVHSGDLGRKDDDGFFYITGRIKEIIITAGGENIAPVPIEEKIKAELPAVKCLFFSTSPHTVECTILNTKLPVGMDQTNLSHRITMRNLQFQRIFFLIGKAKSQM